MYGRACMVIFFTMAAIWGPFVVAIFLRLIEHIHLYAAFGVAFLLWFAVASYFEYGFNAGEKNASEKARKQIFDLEVQIRSRDSLVTSLEESVRFLTETAYESALTSEQYPARSSIVSRRPAQIIAFRKGGKIE